MKIFEDVFNRPPPLEEPFVQTLVGKSNKIKPRARMLTRIIMSPGIKVMKGRERESKVWSVKCKV